VPLKQRVYFWTFDRFTFQKGRGMFVDKVPEFGLKLKQAPMAGNETA